jgi:hypothetical protein
MKKVAAKLTVLVALGCLYVLGLNAATRASQPRFQACCKSGGATCCGSICYADDNGCHVIS